MKEHNCEKMNSEYAVVTGPFGWFLEMRHKNIGCQITHCPFCGEKLNVEDLKYPHLVTM